MKALLVSALSDDLSGVALADLPIPPRASGEVLVRVRAAALNYPDWLMTRGLYQLKPPLPFVPGMEVSGMVVEADPGSGWAVGDAVVAGTRLGGFAEYVSVAAAALQPKPPTLSHAAAAATGAAYLTAYVALMRLGRLAPGEWVLVHGATGGVGLATVDLAGATGARVVATSRDAAKLALVAAEYAPAATLPATGFREQVKALTGGGADLVLDPVGGDVFDESTRCMRFGGRLLVVGFASGRIPAVAANIPLIKGFSLIGVRAGEHGRRFPDAARADRAAVWAMAEAGTIRPRVHARFPLDEWRDAFMMLAASGHVGKIVLDL